MEPVRSTTGVPRDFDIDVLRSLVAFDELGSLSSASRRRGRTVAALSLQMRKLEDQAGAALFAKAGRHLALTGAGEVMLSYARRILALNDEAQSALRATAVSGTVRLGASQDFGDAWLPPVLARFKRRYDAVGLDVTIDRSSRLIPAVEAGELDLALTVGMGSSRDGLCVGHLPLNWIAHRDFAWDRARPLPLAVFPTPCRFRAKAHAALDARGIGWEVAMTSSSLQGIRAAVRAKLGVTLRTAQGMLPEFAVVDDRLGLPGMGHVDVSLTTSATARSAALDTLRELLRASLEQRIVALGGVVARRGPPATGRRVASRTTRRA